MAQLRCIGLSWPLYKSPPFGSCVIYIPYGVLVDDDDDDDDDDDVDALINQW